MESVLYSQRLLEIVAVSIENLFHSRWTLAYCCALCMYQCRGQWLHWCRKIIFHTSNVFFTWISFSWLVNLDIKKLQTWVRPSTPYNRQMMLTTRERLITLPFSVSMSVCLSTSELSFFQWLMSSDLSFWYFDHFYFEISSNIDQHSSALSSPLYVSPVWMRRYSIPRLNVRSVLVTFLLQDR